MQGARQRTGRRKARRFVAWAAEPRPFGRRLSQNPPVGVGLFGKNQPQQKQKQFVFVCLWGEASPGPHRPPLQKPKPPDPRSAGASFCLGFRSNPGPPPGGWGGCPPRGRRRMSSNCSPTVAHGGGRSVREQGERDDDPRFPSASAFFFFFFFGHDPAPAWARRSRRDEVVAPRAAAARGARGVSRRRRSGGLPSTPDPEVTITILGRTALFSVRLADRP